jgi:16S rRNA (cytosine967-C5)-methyltransferase
MTPASDPRSAGRGDEGSGRLPAPERHTPTLPAGFAARELATVLLKAVLADGHALDDAISRAFEREHNRRLAPRDRALARLIAATVLRRLGQLEQTVGSFIQQPLPAERGNLDPILLAAAAQLLFLGTPAHAVIHIAVEQCRRDRRARRFDRLANAVLRRIAEQGPRIAAGQDHVRLNIPDWILTRWVRTYSEETARKIAESSLREAALDVTVKADPELWAARLGGHLLPTKSVRLSAHGRVEDLPGYAEGAWWVQDAAAALPARLLGPVHGWRIADLCAAPGGKTAALAAQGAHVTAIDISAQRLARLSANLARLQLHASLVEADACAWAPGAEFDAVMLDAPCTATGTIRRHPDILRLKRPSDVEKLADLQSRLLRNATRLVKLGGLIVYCVCSLEPEEGRNQIERFLAANPDFARAPVRPEEIGAEPEWVTAQGDLQTFPFHLPLAPPEMSGLDGFYAARLKRLG